MESRGGKLGLANWIEKSFQVVVGKRVEVVWPTFLVNELIFMPHYLLTNTKSLPKSNDWILLIFAMLVSLVSCWLVKQAFSFLSLDFL